MWRREFRCSVPMAVVGWCVLAGCSGGSPATFPVVGRVLFPDGTPVTSGTIELESVDRGVNARGVIQPDGSFQLSTYEPGDGALAGKHRVAVVQVFFAQSERAIHHDHSGSTGRPRRVHPKHARYESSGLTVEVLAGRENRLSIVVESAP